MPIRLGAIDEVRATVAHVAATDAPLADVFSLNATVRSRLIELYYLRSLAESRRLEDPEPLLRTADDWPADGKLAPRQETQAGEHAGVLTAPHIRNQIFDYRQRQRIIFEVMWCAGESAPGALPEDVLSLHTANLSIRNEGWRELAGRPNCTHCHARLDYGMQFFRGHTVPINGPWHYVAGANAGERGPLYGTGIDDPRGEAPLTAQGFARLATRQPEFARCMATNAAEYVFGYTAPAKTIDHIAGSAPPQELRFRGMLRAAVLEFVGCDSCQVPGRELPRAPDTQPTTGTSFAKLVDAHCSPCHYDGASLINLEGAVDAGTRARALDNVLFGRMPPTGPLSSDVRRQFLDAVNGSRSAGGAYDRAFLRVAADPPRALPLIAARAYIRQLAGHGSAVSDVNTLEMALNGRDTLFTPNYAAVTAIEAYRGCENVASAARAACVDRALDGAWNPAPRSGRSGR